MKRVLALLVLVSCLIPKLNAAVFATNNLAATNNFLISGAFVLQSLTLTTTNDTPTLVRIYDGQTTTVTAAYTNWTSYNTNIVTSYLTSTGTTNTVTNYVNYIVLDAHAAATNATPVKIAAAVTKQTPFVWNPVFGYGVSFSSRMTLSNDAAGISAIVQYRLP